MSALRFTGYDLFAHRFVPVNEIFPDGSKPLALRRGDGDPLRYHDYVKEPFCVWSIFQRLAKYSATHVPFRFSLLFICADGCPSQTQRMLTRMSARRGFGPSAMAIFAMQNIRLSPKLRRKPIWPGTWPMR